MKTTYNKSQILKNAWRMVKGSGKTLSAALKESWAIAKGTNEHVAKTWILSIPFGDASARNRAKQAGATWNADKKVWVVTTTPYKLDVRNLVKYVI